MHLYFALASPKFREQKDNLAMKPQTSNFFFFFEQFENLRI